MSLGGPLINLKRTLRIRAYAVSHLSNLSYSTYPKWHYNTVKLVYIT
jgi:hypothetical protein